jgi:hypothetical protein
LRFRAGIVRLGSTFLNMREMVLSPPRNDITSISERAHFIFATLFFLGERLIL